MEVDIGFERTAKTLDQGNGTSVNGRFSITSFPGRVRCNGAADNTQRLAHDFGLAGKLEPEGKRHAEYPLTHGFME